MRIVTHTGDQYMIEANDPLPQAVRNLISEVTASLKEHAEECKLDAYDIDELEYSDVCDTLYFGERIDSAVPIYTGDIEDAWLIHEDELKDAYELTGIAGDPRENSGMTAIYFYIEQALMEKWDEIKDSVVASLKGDEE